MKKIIAVSSLALLSACAGSASHKVVVTDQVQDQALTCRQIDDETARAQAIINGVNDDKNDVSGADVMDGIFYFPFNLIAKNSNYNNALTAANQRIISLKTLKQEKGCPLEDKSQTASNNDLESKIKSLNKVYQDKLITEDEYKSAKLKLLGL